MASSKQKVPSFFRCCINKTDKSKKDAYYIRNSLNDDVKNGIMDRRKQNIRLERTDRAPEMTALEFEDDDEGFCIGYARILKTPQKERRIKLKPTKKIKSDEEEDENEDKNVAERKTVAETESMQQQKHNQNHISIGELPLPSAIPQVHQKMAMIATVQPFKQQQHNGNSPKNKMKEEEQFNYRDTTDGFRIEDVTDDPKYKDYDNDGDDAEFEEGALVEYCRSKVVKPSAVLKQPPLVVRRPSSAVRTQNMVPISPKPALPVFGRTKATTEMGSPLKTTSTSTKLKGANGNLTAKNGIGGTSRESKNTSSLLSSILPMHSSRRNTTLATTNPTKQTKLVSSGSSSSSTGGNSTSNTANSSRLLSNSYIGQNEGRAAEAKTFLAVDPTSKPQMAHVIDVEVGQPCSKMAICNCYGFRPHSWRKVCIHCKCERSDHELGPNQSLNVYERLGIKPSGEMAKVLQQRKQSQQQGGGKGNHSANNNATMANNNNELNAMGSVQHGYAWVPPGISRIKVEDYMSQLPNHMIPRLNSIGEKNRERQLMVQLPRQDLSIAYCKHLKTPQERRLYEEFVNARNEVALDIGYVNGNIQKALECRKCRGIVERNEMAVVAPKLGESTGWHPACFACQTCDQLLVDLTYCVRDEKVYCERHFAELHKPRCSACDELIFSGEYTKAMNKDWHSDHFCCWQCDGQLTGQRYILRDDHPYCIKCYEEIFANVCDECQKHIGIDSKDLSYKEKHWHEECFLCSLCKISLVDKPFGSKTDRIYCSNCYDQAFATRCDGCGEIFKAGMKKMEYKGKQWHDKCFVCAHCKSPIGTRSFIPKNEEVFCANCYEEKFATRCCKCKKVISTGGVTYKNEPWHRECFCCTNCNSSLAGQRFTSKDEKPYCADCYGELFAKRCSACVKPITGIGGAKFISFEDRHWHNDCFVCSQCSLSLVGKGFITDGADILCAECAKARLMAANS